LRQKILRKSKEDLWFCQLVQNGMLKSYINILIEENYKIETIIEKIEYIKERLDKFSFFIQEKDTKKIISKEIFRLLSSKPEILLICSKENASVNFKEIRTEIIEQYKTNYRYKVDETDDKLLLILIEKIK
jgi:hypothetical protein